MGPQGLTDRKIQILQMMADGLTPKEIASRLGIMQRTVKKHLVGSQEILGSASRAQMIARAVALGYVHVAIEHVIVSDKE